MAVLAQPNVTSLGPPVIPYEKEATAIFPRMQTGELPSGCLSA